MYVGNGHCGGNYFLFEFLKLFFHRKNNFSNLTFLHFFTPFLNIILISKIYDFESGLEKKIFGDLYPKKTKIDPG
jgi:hypothetical protein